MKANIFYAKEGNKLDLFLTYEQKTGLITYNKLMYIGDNIDEAVEKLHGLTSSKDRTIEIDSIENDDFRCVEEDTLMALKSCFNKKYSHVKVSINKISSATPSQNYTQ